MQFSLYRSSVLLLLQFSVKTAAENTISKDVLFQEEVLNTSKSAVALGDNNELSNPEETKFSGILQESLQQIESLVHLLVFDNVIWNQTKSEGSSNGLSDYKLRITSILKEFQTTLLNASGHFLREPFDAVLKKLKAEFKALALAMEAQLESTVVQLNETVINSTETIDMWTAKFKEELRTVNNTQVYNISCKLFNDFIDYSTTRLQNCCKITIKPAHSLCGEARGALAEVLHFLADTVERMQLCLEDKASYTSWDASCIKLAFDYSSNAITKIDRIWREMNMLLTTTLMFSSSISGCCFSLGIVQIQHPPRGLPNKSNE